MDNDTKQPTRKRGPDGIWQIYNGLLMSERQQGKTLQEIGAELGVSRERVRQVLAKHYGTTDVGLLPEAHVAILLGFSIHNIAFLRKRGLTPVRIGRRGRPHLYSVHQIIEIVRWANLLRICPMCGCKKGQFASKACPDCWSHHRWLLLDEEGKKKILQQNVEWQEKNPDRYKAIQKAAMERYRKKRRGSMAR